MDITAAYGALQKADAAGDTAGAKQLADFIRANPATAPAVAPAPPQTSPPASQPAPSSDAPRQVALAGRAVGEGVLGTLANTAEGFGKFASGASASDEVIKHETGHTPMQLEIADFNSRFGTKIPEVSSFSELLSHLLTSAGAPTPDTPGEQLASAGIRGATGALAMGGGGATVPNLVRTAVSGTTGGLSAEGAKQAGAGPAVQTIAGLLGGLTPSAVEELTRLAGRTASNVVAPLTSNGQQRIASQVLANQASDPQAAASNLDAAQPIVPNSPRNSGEASQDVGLLSLEKGLRSRNPSDFGQRVSEQNAARQAELESVAGTPADLATAIKDRTDTTAPMREQALTAANNNTINIQSLTNQIEDRFRSKANALQDKGRFQTSEAQNQAATQVPFTPVPGQPQVPGFLNPRANRLGEGAAAAADTDPIIAQRQAELESAQNQLAQLKASGASPLEISKVSDRIDGILQTPGLRASQVVQKALGAVRDRLTSLADENGTIDAQDLYTVRKEIGNYVQQAAKESGSWDKRLSAGLSGQVQSAIDDAIEGAAPGFKAYLQRYRDMSQPIDQMKVLQEIQRRSQLTSADVTTGQNFLGNSSFSRALDSAIQKSGAKLTPDQIERMQAIRTDLQAGQAINSPLVKAPGSDTFQNLSIAQAIGMGGNAVNPIARVITKPLSWLYKFAGTDNEVNEVLVRAMLDPKLAADLLKRATPQSVGAFSGRLRAAVVGSGASSMPSGPSATQNSP